MDATMLFEVPANPKHPARYTKSLLPVMAGMLRGRRRILDIFGGVGGVFALEHWLGRGVEIQAIELERRYAAVNPRTRVGNALHLPWADGYFDAICTSPAYGNRLADQLRPPDQDCISYAQALGENLHPDNGGALQWGPEYRDLHRRCLLEARRVLCPSAAFVLNMKDHYRNFELQPVTQWWIDTMTALGFRLLRHERVNTPSMRYGANADLRVEYESVILFQLEANE